MLYFGKFLSLECLVKSHCRAKMGKNMSDIRNPSKTSLIFTGAELLATSHIFFKDGQSTCIKRKGQDFQKKFIKSYDATI